MKWECHHCGQEHDELPERCTSCGTEPEIVLNLWTCKSCGQADIPATGAPCPNCGADQQADAPVAVAPDKRLFGEIARALASGAWRFCAYCKTLVPPVDVRSGRANTRCPTCGGELIEATQRAGTQQVSAADAQNYRAQIVTDLAGAPLATDVGRAHRTAPATTPAAAPPAKKGGVARYVFLALGVLFLLCVAWPTRKVTYQVTSQRWSRSIDIEALQRKTDRGWEAEVPAAAYAKSCQREVRSHRDVPIGTESYREEVDDTASCAEYRDRTERVEDGTESYEEEVDDGKRCVRDGFKMNGGVSVKTCEEWERKKKNVTRTRTKYTEKVIGQECVRYRKKMVTKTRTKYRKEPVYDNRCTFTIDTEWVGVRSVERRGADTQPEWPVVDVRDRERPGARHAEYVLELKDSRGKPARYLCGALPEWKAHKAGTDVLAEVSFGTIVKLLN